MPGLYRERIKLCHTCCEACTHLLIVVGTKLVLERRKVGMDDSDEQEPRENRSGVHWAMERTYSG